MQVYLAPFFYTYPKRRSMKKRSGTSASAAKKKAHFMVKSHRKNTNASTRHAGRQRSNNNGQAH